MTDSNGIYINVLLYLYYNVHIPLYFGVIRIFIASLFLFFKNKIGKKVKEAILLAYYGFVLGGMIGYLIQPKVVSITCFSVIGCVIFLLIGKIDKKSYITDMILLFSIYYIVVNVILVVSKVDFYEVFGVYPDLIVNYANIYVNLIVSAILTIISMLLKSIFVKKELKHKQYIKDLLYGNVFLMGALFADTGSLFYMSGEGEDFFIPLLNLNYDRDIIILPCIGFFIVIGCIIKKVEDM